MWRAGGRSERGARRDCDLVGGGGGVRENQARWQFVRHFGVEVADNSCACSHMAVGHGCAATPVSPSHLPTLASVLMSGRWRGSANSVVRRKE